MAESDSSVHPQMGKAEGEEEVQNLKYLEFVQVASLHALMCFSRLYDYAKDNSGPLKPGVETMEGTVKTVVGPVYDKFHDFPIEVLKFVDHKVDASVNELDRRVPPLVKKVSTQALSAAQKAPSTARAVASEMQRVNMVDTASGLAKNVYTKCEPAAKGLYTKYEPMAEQYAASAWHSLNRLPLFPQVAQAVIPKAAYCTEKYNETVRCNAEKGYKVASYLPLVPTEKIAKVFTANEAGTEPLVTSVGEGAVSAH
ncbi:REF/SRPP-like protein At3g05500 [Actinidia eriantha]|uniref:REF/SRPP-like protein At3g05500 n=1 Tax=Actinidia eriantha TaxID=165200 RepID=UPI00259097B9|nr:REF/SRPP-like protein At3g05500 [Actinidia eriantha]